MRRPLQASVAGTAQRNDCMRLGARAPRVALAGLVVATLTACGGWPVGGELAGARRAEPQGSAFNAALHANYLEHAQYEWSINDYWASDMHARKAKAAAANGLVLPQDPATSVVHPHMTLRPEHEAELSEARTPLMRVLDGDARTVAPERAALAQVKYDCWVEQLEENIQPTHIAACREAFWTALAQLEPLVAKPAPPPPEPEVAPAPAPMPAPAPEAVVARSYLVFFAWDSAELTAEAREVVRTAAENAAKERVTRLIVTGHADRSGPASYNEGLSMRRAEAVRTALESLGVPSSDIRTYAKGERDPLVPTPDGVREPQNRRVEVVFE